MEYKPDFLIDLYRQMLRIRTCEESLVAPIVSGEIKCPCHLCTGQEAIPVGVGACLGVEDYVFGTHRSHGHYLAKGGDMRKMVAEIFCRETGCARGRGGSMHVIAPDKGMLGAAPIVAGTISLSVGAALAAVVRGEPRVSVSFFGDGATGEGVLFESLNLAALHHLPVLFVCENNLYSTHLRINEIRVSEDIHKVAEPFGVWSRAIDGNDVLEVYAAAREAIDLCRSGDGPAFLECKTYRYRGHVGPDDNIQGAHTDIRPEAEVESWKQRDPLQRLSQFMRDQGLADDSSLEAIAAQVDAEVDEALEFARSSEFPRGGEVAQHVFR